MHITEVFTVLLIVVIATSCTVPQGGGVTGSTDSTSSQPLAPTPNLTPGPEFWQTLDEEQKSALLDEAARNLNMSPEAFVDGGGFFAVSTYTTTAGTMLMVEGNADVTPLALPVQWIEDNGGGMSFCGNIKNALDELFKGSKPQFAAAGEVWVPMSNNLVTLTVMGRTYAVGTWLAIMLNLCGSGTKDGFQQYINGPYRVVVEPNAPAPVWVDDQGNPVSWPELKNPEEPVNGWLIVASIGTLVVIVGIVVFCPECIQPLIIIGTAGATATAAIVLTAPDPAVLPGPCPLPEQ